MKIIGLTGPSGAGKGEIGKLFARLGAPVLDCDAIYHALLVPPSACLEELKKAFGTGILHSDGTLNRPELGKVVFSDREKLNLLNTITHRFVLEEAARQMEELSKSGVRTAVLDAPQLFESGADKTCDLVVSVLADEERRVRRIMRRDGITEEAARRRIAAQKSEAFFRAHSDFVIENDCPIEDLLPLVRDVLAAAEAKA